jgi:hypothetical protein
MKRAASRIALGLGVVALLALELTAGPMLDVHIENYVLLPASGPDPFTATGPAVGPSGIFGTGVAYTDPYLWPPGPRGTKIIKHFICGDGSGGFSLELTVSLRPYGTFARWNIIGGYGDYAGLIGSGTLEGYLQPGGTAILDVYDGKIGIKGAPVTFPPWWAGKP